MVLLFDLVEEARRLEPYSTWRGGSQGKRLRRLRGNLSMQLAA